MRQLTGQNALGRLGEGLRRIRQERHLSQADLARRAGVSPSAISQAEAGHRGLALDTLLTLAEALEIGLDDLLGVRTTGDYVLARRDRMGSPVGPVALLDDPAAGLRAYLVQLRRAGAGTALIDPMACPDLSALGDALADTEWVLHAATQDLPCLDEVGMRPTRLLRRPRSARYAATRKTSDR